MQNRTTERRSPLALCLCSPLPEPANKMKIEPGYDELGRQPPQDGFGRLHGFLVRFCFRRWKGGVSAVQERLPERSGDPLGEGLSGWVTGGLRQLLARYCDYCFKPGFFAKYRFCMVVYVQEMSPWPQKFFIVKRRPYSQAGRRRFEPGLPLHKINKLERPKFTRFTLCSVRAPFTSLASFSLIGSQSSTGFRPAIAYTRFG